MVLGAATSITTTATEVVARRCVIDRHALTASRQVLARLVDDGFLKDQGVTVGAHEDSSAGCLPAWFLDVPILALAGVCHGEQWHQVMKS
jgi:hypothetical protein